MVGNCIDGKLLRDIFPMTNKSCYIKWNTTYQIQACQFLHPSLKKLFRISTRLLVITFSIMLEGGDNTVHNSMGSDNYTEKEKINFSI